MAVVIGKLTWALSPRNEIFLSLVCKDEELVVIEVHPPEAWEGRHAVDFAIDRAWQTIGTMTHMDVWDDADEVWEAHARPKLTPCPKVGDQIDGLHVVSVFKATAEGDGCPVVVFGDYEGGYHTLRHLEDLSNEWRDDKGRVVTLTLSGASYWHSERLPATRGS